MTDAAPHDRAPIPAEDRNVGKVGLIGPRSSGKTQFKVYLLDDSYRSAPCLERLYGPMPTHVIEGDPAETLRIDLENNQLRAIESRGLERFQQRCQTNTGLPVEVRLRYKSTSRTPERALTLYDFAGQSFNRPAGVEQDAEKSRQRRQRFEQLQAVDDFLLLVPFWHLLPPELFQAVLRATDRHGSTRPIEPMNDLMSDDMDGWYDALKRIPGSSRRLVVAISQFGGETLWQWLGAIDALDGGVAEPVRQSLRELNAASDQLARLAARDTLWPSDTFRVSWLLREIYRHGRGFVETCEAGGNPSARHLLRLAASYPLEVIAFNVIDDRPEVLQFDRSGVRLEATFFKQEPRNVQLVFLKFWQRTIRDLVW